MSEALRRAYALGKEDETLTPLVLNDKGGYPVGRISKGDSVIFYNIRGEREIQLTRALTDDNFDEFPVDKPLNLNFATMIEYHKSLNVQVAFPPEDAIQDTLSDIISQNNLRQVKITEAEKAVHISFFLNGKKDNALPGEEIIVVPTRKDVSLFDEAPEMSIEGITKAALEKINDENYHFIVVNLPNVDVVAHIENDKAVIKAIEAVDRHAGILVDAARKQGIPAIVTADHGTAEKWRYPDGAVDTGHTNSPVPLILIHPEKKFSLCPKGELAEVAPTILNIMGLHPSPLMSGSSLIENKTGSFPRARRLLLIILDGWGLGDENNSNLIWLARTPVIDSLMKNYPSSKLDASGESVGLPSGTVGNSEAGHLHIGAGRRIYSDRLKIDRTIEDKSFYQNRAFLSVMRKAHETNCALHLMGIVSFFSSHGSINHLFTLMEMAKKEQVPQMFIHAMLGRRGELPESGALYIKKVEEKTLELELGKVASVIGRYWSLDREENWDRIEKTYRMLIYGEGEKIPDI